MHVFFRKIMFDHVFFSWALMFFPRWHMFSRDLTFELAFSIIEHVSRRMIEFAQHDRSEWLSSLNKIFELNLIIFCDLANFCSVWSCLLLSWVSWFYDIFNGLGDHDGSPSALILLLSLWPTDDKQQAKRPQGITSEAPFQNIKSEGAKFSWK